MATIEDLDFTSISDMSNDEAIEYLRQIRLSRRMPAKKVSTKKPSTRKGSTAKSMPKLSAEQAKKLLEMLDN